MKLAWLLRRMDALWHKTALELLTVDDLKVGAMARMG
jgi:hypothetical protein